MSVRNPVVRARGSTVMTAIGSMIAAGLLLTPTGDAAEAGLQAVTSVADPTVGPLFENGLATGHSCTASVLNAGRDLLLTAAHCVTGTGAGVQFAPGYDGTSGDPTPYGVWTVTRTYVPTRWLQDQDADHDYAILQVADLDVDGRAESINEMTGGNDIPLFQQSTGLVTVPAYNAGANDAPIRCVTSATVDQPVPAFTCGGYSSGTSGAPWLRDSGDPGRRVVVGIIGGPYQGGCWDSVSYSPKFDGGVFALLLRATLNLQPDDVPAANDSGC